MNLGDGLLFELENGKPRLILLSHGGVEKNPVKLPSKHRTANVLSARQPSSGNEARPPPLSHRDATSRAGETSLSCSHDGRNNILTSSKNLGSHRERGNKTTAKAKTSKIKVGPPVGPLGSSRRAALAPNMEDGRRVRLKHALTGADASLTDGVVCLTGEKLRQILGTIRTPSADDQRGPEEQTAPVGQTDTNSVSPANEGEDGEVTADGDQEETKERGGADEKHGRSPRSALGWLEERRSDSRAAVDAKKAQWKRELDEQVALKQQQQLQGGEYPGSVLSGGHKEQPAAIRSSLRLGEVSPSKEALSAERKEERRRIWLEELDRQREEAAERRKRDQLLRRQAEDHERWAPHFDSLQRRAPVQPGRDDWDPSSSLSLVWEATSSCGAESVARASVDSTKGFNTRTSYLRTMTSLLDPAQIEERERRRLKQLEQQRAIEAQMEERRKQRQLEDERLRREEEEQEKRLALEREKLQIQYDLEMKKNKEQSEPDVQPERAEEAVGDGGVEETSGSSASMQADCGENGGGSSASFKHTSVQTEETPPSPPGPQAAADRVQTPDASANSRGRPARAGKENVRLPADENPYEPFARAERSRRTKRRPEWNTQRPSRRFVPASERYPAALQKDRQESRLRRQAELLALQDRARLCPNGHQTRTSPAKKVESGVKGSMNSAARTDRGRSPHVPAVRPRAHSQRASGSPPPSLEFVPYLRTAEVFGLDPLEPAATPPPRTNLGAPPEAPPAVSSQRDPLLHPEMLRNSRRQQEILRGLAQLRQGLLQKQKELETDLNHVRDRRGAEQHLSSAAHRT